MQYELQGGAFPVVVCRLQNGEKMREMAGKCINILYNGVNGLPAADMVTEAADTLKQLSDIDISVKLVYEIVNSASIQLSEAERELKRYFDGLETGEDEIEQIDERLNIIYAFKKKYICSSDLLADKLEKLRSEYDMLMHSRERLENLENELKAKEKAINALLAAIEQGIVTKSTKERLISLETQKEELESKISLEKARQIKPLEVDKVKAFLTYFARKKYENGQEKNAFFNSFINRVILYDDKILIFYNTDDNHPTVIKRKDTEELISHLNDIASNGKTATNDCQNATGNDNPIGQKENSFEPQGFKRVSLGGERGI